MTYSCAGLQMPADAFVPCYRAGHKCHNVTDVRLTSTHRITTNRCGCCGQFANQIGWLLEWDDEPTTMTAALTPPP